MPVRVGPHCVKWVFIPYQVQPTQGKCDLRQGDSLWLKRTLKKLAAGEGLLLPLPSFFSLGRKSLLEGGSGGEFPCPVFGLFCSFFVLVKPKAYFIYFQLFLFNNKCILACKCPSEYYFGCIPQVSICNDVIVLST